LPDTSKLEKLNRELEKSEKKLRKAINDEKALQHQLKQLTRKERTHRLCTKGAIIHHSEDGALRSPKAPRRRAVIFRSHGLLQIKQGTLHFPCAGCRQLPFCGLAIWEHLALQAVPSRQV